MVVVVRLLSDLRPAAEAQRPYQDRSSSSPHSLSVLPLEQTARPSIAAREASIAAVKERVCSSANSSSLSTNLLCVAASVSSDSL